MRSIRRVVVPPIEAVQPSSHIPDTASLPRKLTALNFDNTFTRQLPRDGNDGNHTRHVLGVCFSSVDPTPVINPKLVHANRRVAKLIDLDESELSSALFVDAFSGMKKLAGSYTLSQNYAGHQFGQWAGQLGDGRAISLGEIVNSSGERWELQLKGAGMTPYSRFADGRAVLRSSIREYLCSEAMVGLGIPTTQAMSLITSETIVQRETFEKAAVVCRVAPSWIRFGSFEHHYYFNEHDTLKMLADYTILHHFPSISITDENRYQLFFKDVCEKTAQLIAAWQCVGFVHGVLNTDNMSILGLTIDYGPFGFLDEYDPTFIINHSDSMGVYTLQRQPDVGMFNLKKLAIALSPLLPVDQAVPSLQIYWELVDSLYMDKMRQKLGLTTKRTEDTEFIAGVLDMLAEHQIDWTQFFRQLGSVTFEDASCQTDFLSLFPQEKLHIVQEWLPKYQERLKAEDNDERTRKQRMDAVNPSVILRNWMAEDVIKKAEAGDFSGVSELFDLLGNPFDDHADSPVAARYRGAVPTWAQGMCLSCSS